MALELPGDLLNDSFCGLDDIEDISRQRYEADAQPDIDTCTRKAQLQANSITLRLESKGYGVIIPGGPEITADAVLALALRRLNALKAAYVLVRDTHPRDRPELAPQPESLLLEIGELQRQIEEHLNPAGSAAGLASNVTTNDTLFTDPFKGKESRSQRDWIRLAEKF